IRQDLGDRIGLAYTLSNLGTLAYEQGDYPQARRRYEEAWRAGRPTGSNLTSGHGLALVARTDAALGHHARAARLLGAASAVRRATGEVASPGLQAEVDILAARLRDLLGEAAFAEAFTRGERLRGEEIYA